MSCIVQSYERFISCQAGPQWWWRRWWWWCRKWWWRWWWWRRIQGARARLREEQFREAVAILRNDTIAVPRDAHSREKKHSQIGRPLRTMLWLWRFLESAEHLESHTNTTKQPYKHKHIQAVDELILGNCFSAAVIILISWNLEREEADTLSSWLFETYWPAREIVGGKQTVDSYDFNPIVSYL